jgi:transposase InsO family protein
MKVPIPIKPSPKGVHLMNFYTKQPLIAADLRAEPEFSTVSKNRVARHMKDMGLRCKTVKKFEVYYNRRRRHSTNGYKSPAMFEMDWMKQKNVA